MKKYKYKIDEWIVDCRIHTNPLEEYCKYLNRMGQDGWELISYTKTYTSYNHTYTYLSTFKAAYYDE